MPLIKPRHTRAHVACPACAWEEDERLDRERIAAQRLRIDYQLFVAAMCGRRVVASPTRGAGA
jgi:hypothetical protein